MEEFILEFSIIAILLYAIDVLGNVIQMLAESGRNEK